jgi:DNA-binding GntR family transcriptional regulator
VAIVDDILHRVDVCTVLECHAVARAASLATSDRARPGRCSRIWIWPRTRPEWNRLRLHRCLNNASGNLVLASMVERMARNQTLYGAARRPVYDSFALRLLHAQHKNSWLHRGGHAEMGSRPLAPTLNWCASR